MFEGHFRHVSCVNFLLTSGADPFLVDKIQRRSAIHYAAAAGQASVLKVLLSNEQLMHTEDGMQALKHVRIHDISGQCRSVLRTFILCLHNGFCAHQ